MRYLSGDQRRRQILLAGVELVRSYGWEAVSVERIARRLEISQSLVRHYFQNKDSLTLAIAEHAKTIQAYDLIRTARERALIR